MNISRRDIIRCLGTVSLVWFTGCSNDSSSSRTPTGSTTEPSTSSRTKVFKTPEPQSPELTIINLSDDTHTIGVRLGQFEFIPDGGGTPIESGTFVLNDEFKLAPAEEIRLREYRTPGEHYNFVLIVDRNVVIDEFLDYSEGLTIEIFDSETVETQRTYI